MRPLPAGLARQAHRPTTGASHLLQREVERACEVATESVALSEAIGSARVVERLGEFHVALDPFATSKSAQEFRELYVGVMAQRSSVN